jgi:Uma2 family endonuclease
MGIVVGPDTGFFIERDPDSVRSPDIAFVAQSRIDQTGIPKKFFPGAPDLAVEVLSPGDKVYEVDEKIADWLAAGTKLVWVIHPNRRTVSVHRPKREIEVLSAGHRLSGEDVVKGFECAVEELFE